MHIYGMKGVFCFQAQFPNVTKTGKLLCIYIAVVQVVKKFSL